LAGVGLWVPVPFYLVALDDPKAQKKLMEYLNRRFKFEIDLKDFDASIIDQNRKINEIRNLNPEIDTYLTRIESNLNLSEDENIKLVSQVEEYLKQS
jgi:proteasome assembly chaperone (PAC2) family protein